ncbi:MAG: hypothetical protein JXX14_15555 [Deltaproteobacteria bacterium]|nr:hypothetical protein [Deltaproteobacteria bacterium]
MFIHTVPERDFTLFYFNKNDSYRNILKILEKYLEAGPTRDELFYFDSDARLITPSLTKKLIPIVARSTTLRPPGSRTAVLLGRDSLYGLGRIYKAAENKIFRRPWVTRLFRDLQGAAQWLNVDEYFIADIVSEYNASRPFVSC